MVLLILHYSIKWIYIILYFIWIKSSVHVILTLLMSLNKLRNKIKWKTKQKQAKRRLQWCFNNENILFTTLQDLDIFEKKKKTPFCINVNFNIPKYQIDISILFFVQNLRKKWNIWPFWFQSIWKFMVEIHQMTHNWAS